MCMPRVFKPPCTRVSWKVGFRLCGEAHDGADPDAKRLRDLANAKTLSPHRAHFGGSLGITRFQRGPAERNAFVSSPRQPCLHPLLYHRAFELAEHAHHLEHSTPRWRARIEALLM